MSSARDSVRALVRAYLAAAIRFCSIPSFLPFCPHRFSSALKFSGTLLESLLATSLLAAILPVTAVRSRAYLLLAVGLVWLARPVTVWLDHLVLSAITLGIWILIGLAAAAAALRYAMRAGQVDAEHLYAALSAYLLAGL